ncbi:bifunctional DNA primase/polymerase [Streptomyces sp. NPDC004667]|uniref:bifunctional DNA primase/polymerase n=1 Tax=Streptomyces sp. NPDC004667 TaxID=3154285 RepID=UPI0033B7D69E
MTGPSARGPHPSPRSVARWCAAQGWPVHPLAHGAKTPPRNCPDCRDGAHTPEECPCLPAGRRCHGFHAATTDPGRIDAWWAAGRFGVGVACGPAGLVVIDIDSHGGPPPPRGRLLPGIDIADEVDLTGLADGFHTLAVLAALRGAPTPARDEGTLRVRTPSGGLHVWYRAGDGPGWHCSSGSGRRALAWQVDVRAHGGYIVAPGTVTRDGAYEPVGPCRAPAPLPHWLAGELTRTGHAIGPVPESPPTSGPSSLPAPFMPARPPARSGARPRHVPYPRRPRAAELLRSVLGELAACAAAPTGAGFTERLNRAAYTVGGLVAAGHLDAGAAERALTDAAALVRPGQRERARRVITAGLAAGFRRPLHLGGRG